MRAAAAPALAALFTAYSLHRSQVDLRDIVVFGLYVVLGLVLPGAVLWRMLVSRGTWSLLADLACGTSLAYAVELGVYFLCAHVDHPGAAFVWPVVPLGLSLLPRFRAQVWRRAEQPTPPWIWALLSAIAVYGVSLLTRTVWNAAPIEGPAIRNPYVDIPYHLALIGALSRHVPAEVPAVAGEPLYYHWFVHAELAASRHATGIEPLVLLTRLGPLVMAVVVILGVPALAHRITGSWATGGVSAVLLCLAGGASLSHDFVNLFLSGYIFLSPTTVFAMALLVALLAVSLELLRRQPSADSPPASRLGRLGLWLVLVLVLGAISGAKGSLLPVLLGGYVSIVAMALLVERRLHRTALGITAVGVVWFLVAQQLVYGGSSQGTSVKLFATGDRVAFNLGFTALGEAPFALAGGLTLIYLISRLTLWAPVAGLLTRDVWTDPRAHFLVGGGVAATGAVLVFDSAGFNQIYFLLVAPPLIAISSAWGLTVLVSRVPREIARPALLTAVVTGIVVGYPAKELFGDNLAPYTEAEILLPPLVAVLICLVVALVVAVRRGGGYRRLTAVLVASTAIASLGLPMTISTALTTVTSPRDQFRHTDQPHQPVLGRGGIRAARWLRDHSSPGDLVATNAHCMYAHRPICDHRTTWIAAFTERQMLLEGWSYTSRTGEEVEKQGVSVGLVDFWHPQTLEDNDAAFAEPNAARIERLHDHYGVDWMFVDRRYPSDVEELRKYAKQRFHVGQYVIFRLR